MRSCTTLQMMQNLFIGGSTEANCLFVRWSFETMKDQRYLSMNLSMNVNYFQKLLEATLNELVVG